MIKSTANLHKRCASLLAALLIFVSVFAFPVCANATARANEEHVILQGKFEGKFELTGNKSKLFHLENVGPGDVWSGKIYIKNSTGRDMDISLLSIASNIEDMLLFDALTLDISCNGEVLYSGSYHTGLNPVLPKRILAPKTDMVLNIQVTVPITAGNELLSKEMDSTWTFEANMTPPENKPQTGVNLLTENTLVITVVLVLLLALFAAYMTYKRIRSVKKDMTDRTKGGN